MKKERLYRLHTEQLLMNIQEFVPEDSFLRHSNSYNYLIKEMDEFQHSCLTQQEVEIEKLVDTIKSTESTLECICAVKKFMYESA
jgi:hypothetical protein